ncbi:MAG TPA: fructose-specific PTS transporter subunit EIIC [Nocardioidaceae bacterium]
MSDLITPGLVRLDAALGSDKTEVIRGLAAVAAEAARTANPEGLIRDVLAREATSATGLPGGIAIPHCRTEHVDEPTLVFARLSPATDFGAKDGPADLAFLIAAPAGGDATHLQLLTQLARALVKKDFTDALRSARTPEEVVTLVSAVVHAPATSPAGSGAPAAPSATTPAPEKEPAAAPATARRRLVAVTSCPTGIAHTYMAAESLEAAAARAGVDIAVETQGSAGSSPLPQDVIDRADAVVFAADLNVKDRGRFAGKPLVAAGVKRGIDDADGMVATALAYVDDPDAPRVEGSGGGETTPGARAHTTGDESWGLRVRRVLMTGVSYMIPFVAAGGLLIALGFLFGGYQIALGSEYDGEAVNTANHIITNSNLLDLPDPAAYSIEGTALENGALLTYLGALFFSLGAAAFAFLVPALAGYIAFAIADRPGIAPGFVMGFVANSVLNAGFLGGIVGGVLAGIAAHWLAARKVPVWARGLMPVLVIPLGATLAAGFVMVAILGEPLSALMSELTQWLEGMSGASAIVLGVILGLMMAFDMGGPLNKTAYTFATAGVGAAAASTGAAPELKIMAAVMLAGMVPPLALALATVVRPGLFSPAERENGKAAWALGASFITEGAIPFAAADPLRVIPSIMAGSAVTGAIAMATDVTLRAPHGGIFVLFAVGNVLWFLFALLAGVLVAAGLVVALKTFTESKEEIDELAHVSA